MRRFRQFLLLALIGASCVKQHTYIAIDEMVAATDRDFSSCSSLEGSATLGFYQNNDFLIDIEADWVAEPSGNWRMELSDRLGRSAGFITYFANENVLAMSGTMPRQIPKLETNSQGFLVVSENFVGLKARDLPCHFAGLIPDRWQSKVWSKENTQDAQLMQIDDQQTSVGLKVFKDPAASVKFCFTSSWSSFLFFSNQVESCRTEGERDMTEMKFGSNRLRISEVK